MKLNTRVLLLVAPVIMLSAAVSSYSIYINQKDALIKRENSYLQLSMEKLAGHFRQSLALINSYSLTLTKSDIIRNYFGQADNPYREVKLISNLQTTIETLQSNKQDDIAVAIVDSNQNVKFYADNQTDPFASLDENVLKYVENIYQSTGYTSYTGFAKSYQGQSILVRYDVLDRSTLVSPLSYNKDQIFFIVVSLSLEKFDQLKHILEFDNDSSIFFADEPVIKSGLAQSVELKPGLHAILDPAQYLTTEKLAKIEQRLLMSFGASSLVTVLILLFLLYRHVIKPITHLDRQLQDVEMKRRSNIEKLNNDNEIGRLSIRFYDMYKELNSSYQKTKAMAENDHLTQLANRYQFQTYVERSLAQKLIHKFAWILYIDLDNFKYVNDKYGHHIGDSLLVSFAEHIKRISLEYERRHGIKCLASRLSGDEFAIFIAAAHNTNYAEDLAHAVLEPIQNPAYSSIGNFPITASIGITSYPDDGTELVKLLSHADTAMYQAKRAGKNQIAYYSKALDDVARRQAQVERALRNGDLENEFTLLYQPYFDRSGEVIKGVEALLRWDSPQLGKVNPSEFIPISEQIGLFGTIDRWVIKQAFKDFTKLQGCFETPINLSINLSSAELDSLQLASDIQSLMLRYPVTPHLIDFEITETFASDSQSYLLLHELAQMGFKLTIDDFGSGYTSITQLVEYPVQKIKFDREFLETLIKTNNHQVVKPLVDLCHSQSMIVTAEGIESEEMHRWLAENKCDYMQGFYLSSPLSLAQLKSEPKTQKGNLDIHEEGYCSLA
ncbi:sensory box/GGDEF family protein [Vibrio orientalis CIP 102891 = ATCC 33934]|uniref:Sensory box/GGDEF family protein n=2 Tax=Vibrio orientalis CIP 102891 = ATCC 33934 TaxID=675816 RepID=F9STU4_VIBOR|nr:EAL domain-containing protein [Vibrio orientalis]EGU49864.1 sensory box/GGDEF family protein [Vibrio orientalis CIP 102891 = ATCC 33934]